MGREERESQRDRDDVDKPKEMHLVLHLHHSITAEVMARIRTTDWYLLCDVVVV